MANLCVNCGAQVESKGTKPKMYCSDKCKRTAEMVETEQTNKREPSKLQTNIPKRTKTFTDLPLDVQQELDGMMAWCKSRGVEDDRNARIERALHEQTLFPG